MTDPQILAWLDQEDARVAACIREHGVYIQFIGGGCGSPCCAGADDDDGPDFAYTVGLFGLGHPELLIFGAGPHTAAAVLNELTDRVRGGADLVPGEMITFAQWPHRIVPESVPNPGEIVFTANRHYQRPDEFSVPVLQLSYDDHLGRFPVGGRVRSARQPTPTGLVPSLTMVRDGVVACHHDGGRWCRDADGPRGR